MAYTPKNKLTLILRIQEMYSEKKETGVTTERIYRDIANIYLISRGTFYKYLNINAKKELKQLRIEN